jgi:hypothetical protein
MDNTNKFNVLSHLNLDKRGEDGKPITKPRNILSGVNRSGVGKKGYFGVP